MSAQDKLTSKLGVIFPKREFYVDVMKDGTIIIQRTAIDGGMKLVQLQQVAAALADYFEEVNACPF